MATITTAIKIQDAMTPAFHSMNNALNIVLNSFEALQDSTHNAMDTASIQVAKTELANANATIIEVEENIRNANNESNKMPQNFANANNSANNLVQTLMRLSIIQRSISMITGQVSSAISRIDTLNNYPKVMANLGISAEHAEASMQMLSDGLKGLPTRLNDAVGSVQRFTSANGNVGASTKMFLALNNAILAGGAEMATQQSALEQLSQSYAKGKPDMTEWRSAMSAMPAQLGQVATVMNFKNADALGTALTNGKVSMNEFMKTLIELNEKGANGFPSLAEQAKNSTGGLQTSIENMRTAITKGITEMIKSINRGLETLGLGSIQDIINNIGSSFENILTKIGNFVEGIMTFVNEVRTFISSIIEPFQWIGDIISNTWAIISPILYKILAVLAIYAVYTAIVTLATKIWAAAQAIFNGIMAMNPIMLVVIAIILLISMIYKACVSIAQMTGVANSGFGVICGGVNVVLQFFKNLGLTVANIALGIWEALKACASNIGTAFHNAINGVQSWFYNLLSTALNVVGKICEALNNLPFIEFDYSGITDKANEYASKASELANNKEEYTSISDAFSKGMSTFNTWQDGWVSNAFNAGASWGDGIEDKVSNMFNKAKPNLESTDDYKTTLDNLNTNTGNTAGNTGKISDTLDATEEDLQYLRDIAERETINRFTTAEIKVDFTSHNNINSEMDIDGIVDSLGQKLEERLEVVAERSIYLINN